MTHDAASVAFVKDPSKRLGEVIGWVDDARDECHECVTSIFPVLCGEVLDVDVARATCRNACVDHVDGRLVVTVQRSGT